MLTVAISQPTVFAKVINLRAWINEPSSRHLLLTDEASLNHSITGPLQQALTHDTLNVTYYQVICSIILPILNMSLHNIFFLQNTPSHCVNSHFTMGHLHGVKNAECSGHAKECRQHGHP